VRRGQGTARYTERNFITHTTNGLGPEQVEFLLREGVDPAKVVIGHLGFEPDPKADVGTILRRGAYVAFDRIELIRFVLDQGYQERVLLSHDAVTEFVGPEVIAAHTGQGNVGFQLTRGLLGVSM
jgi:predicted metal-dependent phosphotriesterase family hydrolase